MSTSGPSSAKGEKVAYFEKTPWKGTIAFGENQYLGVGLPGGPGVKSEPTEWEIHFSTSNVVSARISTHTDDGQQRFLSHSGKWDKEKGRYFADSLEITEKSTLYSLWSIKEWNGRYSISPEGDGGGVELCLESRQLGSVSRWNKDTSIFIFILAVSTLNPPLDASKHLGYIPRRLH